MTYGLPVAGELNWDVKLSASVNAVKATADAAETPAGAQAKANAAQSAATAAAATDATTKANAVQSNLTTHIADTGNPHATTKAQVGLGNVDNTADSAKPVSTAQQTALDAKANITRTINAQTGTTYTAVFADAGAFVTMTNASASTFTVPPNSSVAFPVGTVIEGAQLGAGQVTLTPGAAVTINATPGLKLAAQYSTFGLLKTATDTWLAYGRLSA